ncbi:unnamed protein product [Agarophyton chilense]
MAFVTPQQRFLLFGGPRTHLHVSRHKRKILQDRQKPIASIPLPNKHSHTPNIDYEDFVSDDTHVVLDNHQISSVLEKLKASGRDTSLNIDWQEDFLSLAEEESNEKYEEHVQPVTEKNGGDDAKAKKMLSPGTMNYFCDENLSHMPRWLREMYVNGSHEELENDADRFCNKQRLHDIVARKKDLDAKNMRNGDGIVDCTVGDVADDYSVPVEFVVDAMLAYGVPVPIMESTSVRNSMTTGEIQKLLKLITSFDHVDLAERYSDDSLAEIAEAYDVDVSHLIDICEKEGLYLCREEKTRLSLVRENRVLDIMFRGADMGRPYPPLLEGLDQKPVE